jgi:hypothetical protein
MASFGARGFKKWYLDSVQQGQYGPCRCSVLVSQHQEDGYMCSACNLKGILLALARVRMHSKQRAGQAYSSMECVRCRKYTFVKDFKLKLSRLIQRNPCQ